ncbi:hypothetical protein O1611_g6905 [Lasiodiplodia mahajangana]|uniref:Uncharacterized protein n=1 Tax=Lasiodiplodia mahajangana TaxID=1108764 RepID=A0ACC2JHM7_9PEZI|nr:hypothetical protein O1611_g6905 [Lasiodiplodia mahajangana]
MAKVQEELGKMFKTFASGFDDEQQERFIADSERIMRRPAGLLLAQAGLDASTSKPLHAIGPRLWHRPYRCAFTDHCG